MKTGIALRRTVLLLPLVFAVLLSTGLRHADRTAVAAPAARETTSSAAFPPTSSEAKPPTLSAASSPTLSAAVETRHLAGAGLPDPEIEELRNALPGILTASGGRSGQWSVLAVSLDRNDTVLALDPSRPLAPASNTKLLTTAAALWHLGPDFRYRTFLLADGPETEGAIEGDLILYGTGDPTLSARFFPSETAPMDSFAVALRRQGIVEIRGDLVVDGSYFQGADVHPEWNAGDLNEAYAAPVSSVSFNENVVTVRVEAATRVGAPPAISTLPEGSGLPVDNLARTLAPGSRSRIWLLRESPSDPIGIEGEMPLGGPDVWRRLPVPDPLRFTGMELKRALEKAGVSVRGAVVTNRDPAASRLSAEAPEQGGMPHPSPRILVFRDSPPLIEILTITNKQSHNFFAETVAKTLGRIVAGQGSFAGGRRVVEDFLVHEVGVPATQISIRDGSGLSPSNRASATVFVQLLRFMSGSALWEDFWSTLPEAGVRNELRRMAGTPAARNLRAKTGTLNRVSALSGMVRTRSGERVLFSVLSNDVTSEYRAKRAEDQIGIRLASLTRPLRQ